MFCDEGCTYPTASYKPSPVFDQRTPRDRLVVATSRSAAMALLENCLNRPRGLGRLLVPRDPRQSQAQSFPLRPGTLPGVPSKSLGKARAYCPRVAAARWAVWLLDRAMHFIDSLDFSREFGGYVNRHGMHSRPGAECTWPSTAVLSAARDGVCPSTVRSWPKKAHAIHTSTLLRNCECTMVGRIFYQVEERGTVVVRVQRTRIDSETFETSYRGELQCGSTVRDIRVRTAPRAIEGAG